MCLLLDYLLNQSEVFVPVEDMLFLGSVDISLCVTDKRNALIDTLDLS